MKAGAQIIVRFAIFTFVTGILIVTGYLVMVDLQGQEITTDRSSVENILERYVDAIGGREAIEKLSTRVCIGKETTDLTSREKPIYESQYFEAHSKLPSSYRTETWTDAGNHIRAFDGKTGWTKDKYWISQDESAGKRRIDWLLNPQNALYIEGYFPDLTLKDTQEVRGHTVYVLESPALHRPLFFDTTTGLLIGFGHNWEIHDYRRIDGVLFPFKIHMSRKGGSTVYEFETVWHNVDINDSMFLMPED
jgi:hypothetical protein